MAAAAIWKITKIAISPQRFERSLRNLVRWCKMALLAAPTVKKYEFHESKMADGRHFKNRYIILSQQPFDWFLLNLARWCMLVPRAWRKFQIFNFWQCYAADRRYLRVHKSEMADGRHFKNRYIILSQQRFDWFLLNLARWCMLVPGTWRKVQIFNFRHDRSPLSSESKNCLNILCSYTMTHYTILTIKQQILILKTAVYP